MYKSEKEEAALYRVPGQHEGRPEVTAGGHSEELKVNTSGKKKEKGGQYWMLSFKTRRGSSPAFSVVVSVNTSAAVWKIET